MRSAVGFAILIAMDETNEQDNAMIPAMRFARVIASTTYPIVSAYEFEFLQEEKIIRERFGSSTIYIIAQRPLTYFDNVVYEATNIWFEIADGNGTPLPCRIDLAENGICEVGEILELEIGFHSDTPNCQQPHRNVGGFKLYRENGEFVLWWSPQKFLYEMLVNGLKVYVGEEADPYAFLDFRIHYIGQSFSQKVWDRLTGHTKMQKILTRERELGSAPEARAPFEISLIILQITGVDDIPLIGADADHPLAGSNPIVFSLDSNDESAFERFMSTPRVQLGDEALTRELEAFLIHRFKPTYNEVLFANYPNIIGGMRSKGYSSTEFILERLPAFLYTDNYSMVSAVSELGDQDRER
ncbi:hypothetical protein [Muricoccus radiodurans]|uniref:hypothetical protein n=1 Tax=Muricoccus radiodurans TaxID=2231721 RepID=UPI003CF20550